MINFDVQKIRSDFPVLSRNVNGKPLVYLDNAATTQKPTAVINALQNFYSEEYATVHRGVYTMSQQATARCDTVRSQVRAFLNAKANEEIIFVRGATEGINLVAGTYGRKNIKAGDEIIISAIEHHANIVPWQILCEEKGAKLKVIPVNDSGELILEEYQKLLNEKTKIVSVVQTSNALGTINPVKEIVKLAKEVGAVTLVDGAQSVPHGGANVRDLDCDFFVFSGHKIYGPTGIGVLYGKYDLLEAMDPYQAGGDMIQKVTFEKTTYEKPPLKFEAGTPAIAETIGLGAALEYVMGVGFENIDAYEQELLKVATEKLSKIEGLKIIGAAKKKSAVISFVFDDIHPHDIGTLLDQEGIAIRTGHHCAQPIMDRFGISATARASFSFYNTLEEVDTLVEAIVKAKSLFA